MWWPTKPLMSRLPVCQCLREKETECQMLPEDWLGDSQVFEKYISGIYDQYSAGQDCHGWSVCGYSVERVTAELCSTERVMWICAVLCSRSASMLWTSANRTKQILDRAMRLEYWMYECRVISCEWLLKFLWVFCFNYWLFSLFVRLCQ